MKNKSQILADMKRLRSSDNVYQTFRLSKDRLKACRKLARELGVTRSRIYTYAIDRLLEEIEK